MTLTRASFGASGSVVAYTVESSAYNYIIRVKLGVNFFFSAAALQQRCNSCVDKTAVLVSVPPRKRKTRSRLRRKTRDKFNC